MQIHGPSPLQGIKGPHTAPSAGPRTSRPASAGPTDQLDISPAAEAAASVAATNSAAGSGEIRQDLVARVRGEIASGSYETPEKIDAALDRFINELG